MLIVKLKYLWKKYRVIKPNGYYFLVSNTGPESRLRYLQGRYLKYDIFVNCIVNDKKQLEIYKDNEVKANFVKKKHYIYICKKVEEKKEVEEGEKIVNIEKTEETERNFDKKRRIDKENKINEGDEKDNEKYFQDKEENYINFIKGNNENNTKFNEEREINNEKIEEDKNMKKSSDKK